MLRLKLWINVIHATFISILQSDFDETKRVLEAKDGHSIGLCHSVNCKVTKRFGKV